MLTPWWAIRGFRDAGTDSCLSRSSPLHRRTFDMNRTVRFMNKVEVVVKALGFPLDLSKIGGALRHP